MGSNRDEFTSETKRTVAERVAWRCSFPGCTLPTVGPSEDDDGKSVRLGEAAHITAASPNGPRFDAGLSSAQRRAASNGIWMCRPHARLVDADEDNYSTETLKHWKRLAERRAYQALEEGKTPPTFEVPTTLVALGHRIVLSAVWKGGGANEWTFRCQGFLRGDRKSLLDEIETWGDERWRARFVVVESQGDGRLLRSAPRWECAGDDLDLILPVHPRVDRSDPSDLGKGLALGLDGDLVLEEGGFAMVNGIDAAVQRLSVCMGTMVGEVLMNPDIGSLCSFYYHRFSEDANTLARLFRLEFARLATIPRMVRGERQPPPLNFVWRVEQVTIPDLGLDSNRRLQTSVVLEWANGDRWSGAVPIYIHECLDSLPEWIESLPVSARRM